MAGKPTPESRSSCARRQAHRQRDDVLSSRPDHRRATRPPRTSPPRRTLTPMSAPIWGMLVVMAGPPSGFEFTVRGDQVRIRHNGRLAATLRKSAAAKFLDDVERGDPQQLMARITGNYKRGNERTKTHRP